MGVSNPELCLSESSFLSRQAAEFQDRVAHQENQEGARPRGEGKDDESEEILISRLEVKLPLPFRVEEEEEEDGLRTPTSLDRKISVPVCPLAPRKPKSVPVAIKRKLSSSQRILLDLSSEIELLFPPVDLGYKIKKVKKENSNK